MYSSIKMARRLKYQMTDADAFRPTAHGAAVNGWLSNVRSVMDSELTAAAPG
jgi:hypothetical protein